jgi:hypothetical protein
VIERRIRYLLDPIQVWWIKKHLPDRHFKPTSSELFLRDVKRAGNAFALGAQVLHRRLLTFGHSDSH